MSDIILISKTGLYETIKCTICKNPNQTERGCDGSCQYDKELHAKIVEAVIRIAEQRPHGEWLEQLVSTECSVCHKRFEYLPYDYRNFCPNCGTPMISSNSEIEKSKSEIVPDYRDGWRLKEGDRDA